MSELNEENQEWVIKHSCQGNFHNPNQWQCHMMTAEVKQKLLELQTQLEQANKRISELEEDSRQALAFIQQIPLHSEDGHVLHYVNMAENWLSKIPPKGSE